MSSSPLGSRPAVGSSKTKIFGLNIDLGKIKDVSSLAKEIARVEEKNE